MLNSIREALLPVSAALAADGFLRRGTAVFNVRMSPHSLVRPARAGQSGHAYDAKFRFHNDGVVRPAQNDQVSMDGLVWWAIWRVLPSALDTHAMLECMSLPTDVILPITVIRTPDAMGGWSIEEAVDVDGAFMGKISSLSAREMLNTQVDATVNRLVVGYWASEVDLRPGKRLMVRDHPYTVMATTTDDTNPSWSRAMLARED